MLDDSILMEVEKPARYTGGEWNAVIKDHKQCAVSLAFCFPDIYEVGMSHLGLRILYHVVNQRNDAVCERVFAPWVDMEGKMRERGIPLFSLETQKPVREFDLVGFTLQYEMSYTNVLNMLDLAGIPLLARDRTGEHPLVCGGGPCAVNPEPMSDFMDFIVIGEGEEIIGEILDRIAEWKKRGNTRSRILRELSEVEGVYVPSLHRPVEQKDGTLEKTILTTVKKRCVADLEQVPFPTEMIVPYLSIIHDRITLELFRGCIRGCRFCQAGYLYRPVREKNPETLVEQACALMASTGYEEISLSSLSTSDYSQIRALTDSLLEVTRDRKVNLSLPSLRADSFSFELMEKMQAIRKSGLTFAPEAGTQRMRDAINKNLTEEEILQAAKTAFSGGGDHLKLYFMLGLPGETDEDILGIAALVKKILATGNRHSSVTVSTSFFVPKPFTPFQWEAQDMPEEMERKQELLSRHLRNRNITYQWHDFGTSRLEAAFSRGDRKLGEVLRKAWKKGCRFDGWAEHFRYENWVEAFRECGIDIEFYTNRKRDPGETLPWDHVDIGISKAFFLREREKAMEQIITPDCRQGCGGCGMNRFEGGRYRDHCQGSV